MRRDYYAVLGIAATAAPREIRQAYRRLARQYSPDVNFWDVTAEARRAVETNDPTRVRQILLASSAIPAAFPCRMIDDGLYVDGGITIQRFLRAGLIQRLIITRVPVLIGAGIPLFGQLPHDIPLRHIATRHYRSGLVQSEYEVAA